MPDTKHKKIIEYIENLPIGCKISVRKVANELYVSEGTAYRAIKEAESLGFVTTMPRVGTVRIKKKDKEHIEQLTFAEIVNIVEGVVLGGKEGLHKTLNRFVIGAMEIEAMVKYIDPNNLLIVGNRFEAQKKALEKQAAVLVTGGFDVEPEIKKIADEKQLPLIQTTYDTFTIATIINRAIYDRLIKKDIVLVEDIWVKNPKYLLCNDTVGSWNKMVKQTTHTRFPVINNEKKVVGIVTAKDVAEASMETSVEKVMTKNPTVTTIDNSLSAVAHTMVWQGIELIPVVNSKKELIGVVSRQDVMKALQHGQKQPQVGLTLSDMVLSEFKEEKICNGVKLSGKITPIMTNHLGGASNGVLMTLLTNTAYATMQNSTHIDTVTENIVTYFLKPVQIDTELILEGKVFELGRKTSKVEVCAYCEKELVCKAIISLRVMEE
ncbi:DRTGG domain-containing protein [Proteinivorax hydrogeniformans]|uniref:DRTGG domain-containing protein n=1 Tax=Proteinivorax hydrogeniformans TaxID=1826727 RepID=A0AAU8HVX2_9FIRM